ncbi:CRISPR-associated endonuclease Cas2 [Candidatus Saccharibacteria bacterium]|jgi:CRISPR-associated protein Cas2|nr:CRISPR-associated endonuclease Cas2 [Candidatus Saccharibacteria bacterium]
MLLIAYDISNTKLRTKFSKMIMKYGRRLQMSVYELNNSPRTLNNVLIEIDRRFKPRFEKTDSVMIIPLCKADKAKILRMGYAVHEEKSVVLFE